MNRIVLVLAVAAAGLTGCGADPLDRAKTEQFVKRYAEPLTWTSFTVTCPQRDIKTGDRFTCAIKTRGRPATRVAVLQKDGKGTVQMVDHLVPTHDILGDISDVLVETSGGVETYCPNAVVARAGRTFNCTATITGRANKPITVKVHMKDNKGGVTYRVTNHIFEIN